MRSNIIIQYVIICMMLLFCSNVDAAEIDDCWAFSTIFSENDIGIPSEHLTTIGGTIINDPTGIVQFVRAKRVSDDDWSHLEPNANGSYEKLYIPAESGQWEIQALDGEESVVDNCITPNLDNLIIMPFVENVTIDDNRSTTPTLCWDPVAGADYYKIRAMDLSLSIYWDDNLSPLITCYQIPGGVLTPGENVYLRIEARDNDDGNLENRSVVLIPYNSNPITVPALRFLLLN